MVFHIKSLDTDLERRGCSMYNITYASTWKFPFFWKCIYVLTVQLQYKDVFTIIEITDIPAKKILRKYLTVRNELESFMLSRVGDEDD